MDGDENEYQFQPPHVGFLPQVLLKVEIGHVLIDETEWVRLSRVHPHEWHYIHIAVVKEAPYVNFVVQPRERRLMLILPSTVRVVESERIVTFPRPAIRTVPSSPTKMFA